MRGAWAHRAPENTQPSPPDNTSTECARQVATWRADTGRLIHPEVALEIASWWASARNHALTAFAGRGEITDALPTEITAERRNQVGGNADDLDALDAYVRAVPTDVFNVLMPVVTLVRAATPAQALRRVQDALTGHGFDPYPDRAHVFASEPDTEPEPLPEGCA